MTQAGLIGVTSGEFARFSKFATSLISVMGTVPPGSGLTWAGGVDVAGNCNQLCRKALAGDYEWLWVMGDDHDFPPDTLIRLLAHNVDVIVPHCLKRYPPWKPVVFSHETEPGVYAVADLPKEGLVRIHAAGSAGMLIRRRVLEKIGDPWFTPFPDATGLNEDLAFCRRAREAGFKLWCDPSVPLGHIALHTVQPRWQDGRWHPEMDHDGVAVLYPRPAPVDSPEIDWDAWRAGYDQMSFADQQSFYNRVAELHPEQRSFDIEAVNRAFDLIGGENLTVHEVGGWDGALAANMLARDDVASWVNWDIAEVPQACAHPGYSLRVLDRPVWELRPLVCDVFVATHTIEHLKARELERIFDTVVADWVYLDAPLQDEPTDWTGYPGSHILEVGWDGIDEMLDARGYAPVATGLWARAA